MMMSEKDRMMNADFLDIAMEEMSRDSYSIAADFIDDVRLNLEDSGDPELAQELQLALNKLDAEKYDKARSAVRGVYEELLGI
jgi:hypothetical protein